MRALGYVGHASEAGTLDMTLGPDWRSELQQWTIMRHGMVHRAHKPYIKLAESQQCATFVTRIVNAVDRIVAGEALTLL